MLEGGCHSIAQPKRFLGVGRSRKERNCHRRADQKRASTEVQLRHVMNRRNIFFQPRRRRKTRTDSRRDFGLEALPWSKSDTAPLQAFSPTKPGACASTTTVSLSDRFHAQWTLLAGIL